MPVYEYECPTHKTIEVQQSIKDNALEFCPKCIEEKDEKVPVKRLISLSGFQLLGTGWANNGYSS